jgi:hypothetical protein
MQRIANIVNEVESVNDGIKIMTDDDADTLSKLLTRLCNIYYSVARPNTSYSYSYYSYYSYTIWVWSSVVYPVPVTHTHSSTSSSSRQVYDDVYDKVLKHILDCQGLGMLTEYSDLQFYTAIESRVYNMVTLTLQKPSSWVTVRELEYNNGFSIKDKKILISAVELVSNLAYNDYWIVVVYRKQANNGVSTNAAYAVVPIHTKNVQLTKILGTLLKLSLNPRIIETIAAAINSGANNVRMLLTFEDAFPPGSKDR